MLYKNPIVLINKTLVIHYEKTHKNLIVLEILNLSIYTGLLLTIDTFLLFIKINIMKLQLGLRES